MRGKFYRSWNCTSDIASQMCKNQRPLSFKNPARCTLFFHCTDINTTSEIQRFIHEHLYASLCMFPIRRTLHSLKPPNMSGIRMTLYRLFQVAVEIFRTEIFRLYRESGDWCRCSFVLFREILQSCVYGILPNAFSNLVHVVSKNYCSLIAGTAITGNEWWRRFFWGNEPSRWMFPLECAAFDVLQNSICETRRN